MGVGKSMKIFMEGMQNSMMSSGYTGKIVNTQMGPFSWDEATNSWVNQNNGFSIPNISLQELMMSDYGTITDETLDSRFKAIQCVYTLSAFSPSSENAGELTRLPSNIVGFTSQTLSNITCPVTISYTANPSNEGNLADFALYTSDNDGVTKPKLSSVIGRSFSAGPFRLYIGASATAFLGLTTIIDLINVSDNNAVIGTYQASLMENL